MDDRIAAANAFLDRDMPDEAAGVCSKILNDMPDDQLALFTLGRALQASGRHGVSVSIYRRLIDINPKDDAYWNNLGHGLHALGDLDAAEEAFHRSIDLCPTDWSAYNNMAALSASRARVDETLAWSAKAKFFATTSDQRRAVGKNFCQPLLATGQWREGWQAFDANPDSKWRLDKRYGQEPHWDGSPAKTVIFHGEQGIGDEIMFASILDEACRDTHAIIDCDARLQGLFTRSFPRATVYGTRHQKQEIPWLANHQVEARCAFGSLGKFYRNRGEDFPRVPYLIPCPTRRRMYRSALIPLSGKKIGLAWTGGTRTTRGKDRSLTAEEMRAFASSYPQHSFISLEYKGDPSPHPIHHWPWAIRTQDYDDTAALVAELDLVISVTTTVSLLAGAVGTPCHTLVPQEPMWHWGYEGVMPWLPIDVYRGDMRENLQKIGRLVCGD